jgi:hypothetical protein
MKIARKLWLTPMRLCAAVAASVVPASAQSEFKGQVLDAGIPIANAMLTEQPGCEQPS